MSRPASMRLEAVDLFCGVGGLTHGLTRAGITVRAGVDTDAACAYPYSKNNGAAFIHRSVTDMSAADIAGLYHPGSLRVLAGCAPCQTFSTYQRSVSDDDRRWWLLRHVGDVATDLQPECVVVENVPGLAQHAVFAEFTDTLVTAGFHVSVQVVRCEEYGIPQSRKRLVVLASRLGPIDLLTPHQFGATPTSVRHAIGGGIVPHLSAGASDPFDGSIGARRSPH